MTTVESLSRDVSRSLSRRDFVSGLLPLIPDALIVTGLGSSSYDVCAAQAPNPTFYLWGAMGAATPLALGLALAQPDRAVVAITGDGEQLMGIGALGTVAVADAPNLTIVVLDNGHYGETGMQRSHASLGTDLLAVASGFGITRTIRVSELSSAPLVAESALARAGATFVHVLVDADEPPRALPPRDGAATKTAFRAALGLETF
jgi:phosphonopyruvate decarboxylase